MLFIGVDLAWAERNESGVVALQEDGRIRTAGWTRGCKATADWVESQAERDTLVFVDAPLVVRNEAGQRLCEKHVGQRYWRARVAANSSNLRKPERLGGIRLLRELERRDFTYDDGVDGPPAGGRIVSECYPYTTIVGTDLLGYDVRPTYKRAPMRMRAADFRPLRATVCDELIRRMGSLAAADPPIDLRSHDVTRTLVEALSPLEDRPYKHREDLLDAALCAWTAALWSRYGFAACQVLGDEPQLERPVATIVAPARVGQR